MGKLANAGAAARPDLPGEGARSPGVPESPQGAALHAVSPPAGRGPASSSTLTHGLPVGDVLRVSTLAGATVLAGGGGLDRVVQRLNVMEVPDILPWVKPHELLLTTGYPLRHTPQALAGLVSDLDARGLAALAIKVGRYLDDVPAEMLARADRLGFPLIRLPDDVGFDDILNQVLTDILDRQASVLARSEEVHRALVQIVLAGGGLTEVADELVGLLGGAVYVTETDGRVLARSGLDEDLRAVEVALADAEGRLVGVDAPYGVREVPGTPGACCVVPVVAGALDHGRIVAYARGPLGGEEVHILERAATVAALVVTRELAVTAVESRYRADFLRDLLFGRAREHERAVRHGRALGWDLARPMVTLVAEADHGPDGTGRPGRPGPDGPDLLGFQDRLAAAWERVVRARHPRAAAAGFAGELVAVLGVPGDGDLARAGRDLATSLAADPAAPACGVTVGVSRSVDGVGRLPEAYEQARTAVRVGRQLHGPGGVACFDALGVYRLLGLVPDASELRSFVTETLGELAGDSAEAADLRRTLQALLDTNLNVAETARRLHYHYNTLRYRISKLERMLGPFTTDAHLRLSLSLALLVVQMRGL